MRAILPSLLLMLSLVACAAPSPRVAAAPSAGPDVMGVLAGSWTGVLEYADYRSDRRVQLPTRLVAAAYGGPGTLTLNYSFREPSGQSVTSLELHRIDVAAGQYVMGRDTFALGALEGFSPGGGGRMVMTGTVMENDRPEPARHTFTLSGDTLRITRETRSPWRFRNEYRLVREPAQP